MIQVICVEKDNQNRKNEIIYDEGFHSVSKKLEKPDELEPIPVDEQKPAEKTERTKPLLITIQLVLCLLLALSLFLLKTTGSALYDEFRAWYDDEMQKTLISQSVFDDAVPDRLFSDATADELPTERD